MQISIAMLLFSDQISGRSKSFQEGKTASGGCPPVEESQCIIFRMIVVLHCLRIYMMLIFSIICAPIILYQLCVSHYNFNVSSPYTLLFILPHPQQKFDLHQWGQKVALCQKNNIMSKIIV